MLGSGYYEFVRLVLKEILFGPLSFMGELSRLKLAYFIVCECLVCRKYSTASGAKPVACGRIGKITGK